MKQGAYIADRFIDGGGKVTIIEKGCMLTYGLAICQKEGFKSAVIKEEYLDPWSSAYSIKLYKKLPKKYQKLLDNK